MGQRKRIVAVTILLGRVALVAQRPLVIELSREHSVGRSVCPAASALWKTADQIRMSFGIVGRTGPVMRHVMGFGDCLLYTSDAADE